MPTKRTCVEDKKSDPVDVFEFLREGRVYIGDMPIVKRHLLQPDVTRELGAVRGFALLLGTCAR